MQPCGMDIAKCANITIRDFKIVTMSRAAPAISRIDADRCRFIASISGAARTTKIILAHFIIPSTERIFSGIFVEYFLEYSWNIFARNNIYSHASYAYLISR